MTEYLDLTTLKKSLELRGETFADDDLRTAIAAASSAVEQLCGRSFGLDAEDVTRSFVPTREGWIEVNDLVSLTAIDSDLYDSGEFTVWADTDYRLEPINAATDGVPYTAIRLSANSAVTCFYPHEGTVRVTGKWGWPEVPAAVKEAVGILAARFVKRQREAPFGVAGSGDGLTVRISSSDPDVALLLSRYSRTPRLA